MPQEFEPVLTKVIRSGTLSASTLTAVDVNLEVEPGLGANIYGIAANFEPSSIADADDQAVMLIGRPDYQVISATDFLEPMNDADFIVGAAQRTFISTNGGGVRPLLHIVGLPTPYLTLRNCTALFFDDNAVELGIVIYYKLVRLSANEVLSALVRGR